MKQHITEKQLNELSNEAKTKLSLWWKKRTNVSIKDEQSTCKITYYPDFLERTPLLSIGQMIEFLDENQKIIELESPDYSPTNPDMYSPNKDLWYLNGLYKLELCDALWEAVKSILNSKK